MHGTTMGIFSDSLNSGPVGLTKRCYWGEKDEEPCLPVFLVNLHGN